MAQQDRTAKIGARNGGREVAASSFMAALLGLGFLATVVAVAPPRANPFGVMIGGSALRLEQRVMLAHELGVSYFRPADLAVNEWAGTQREIEFFQKAGFKLVMTLRNGRRSGPAIRPSYPPADVQKYMDTIGSILDTYKPELLVVENEESSADLYAGTPEQYRRQLDAACLAAHASGVKCANGGIGDDLLARLVWDDYMARGERGKAEAFLERAMTPDERLQMRSPSGRRQVAESISKGKALLNAYRTAAIDYVNFHWYIQDPRALEEAVAFLRARTGLAVITNEIGQPDRSSKTVTALLDKVLKLELPVAIWSSVDRPQARALQDPDGRWRENGLAAKSFLWRRLP